MQGPCRAVTLSKATKVPVVDQYAVQKLSQQENKKTKKQTKNNTAKTGKTHNQNQNQTKNDREKWDRNQQWELHA